MFENLIESTSVRERPLRSTMLSVASHAMLAAAAVVATRGAIDATPSRLVAPDLPYVHLPTAQPAPTQPSQVVGTPAAAPPSVAIAVPIVVPVGLPPIDLDAPSGEALRRLIGMPDHDPTTPTGAPLYGPSRDSILTDIAVDEPVRWLRGPIPVYPNSLRAAGIEGVVVLRMVVDTMGGVESGSIVVLNSTHPGFDAAAIAAVTRAQFVPARLAGRAVRQLVQQGVRFRLD